jgi:hypothetical protein
VEQLIVKEGRCAKMAVSRKIELRASELAEEINYSGLEKFKLLLRKEQPELSDEELHELWCQVLLDSVPDLPAQNAE